MPTVPCFPPAALLPCNCSICAHKLWATRALAHGCRAINIVKYYDVWSTIEPKRQELAQGGFQPDLRCPGMQLPILGLDDC